MTRPLDDQVLVSGQIRPEDVAALKADGVTMIINNRPDGEEPGQPTGADIERAAEEAGIEYCYIPVHRGIGPGYVEAMRDALARETAQKVLVFCRSGHRSTLVWAVARAEEGMDREEVERRAQSAGFDLGSIAHLL